MAIPLIDQYLIWESGGESATAQNAVAYFPDCVRGQYVEYIVYVEFSSGSAAGKVQIQSAFSWSRDGDKGKYAGTWANVGSTIDFSAASKTAYAAVSGVFGALRVIIDTAITTGTVKVGVIAAANP